MKRNKLNHLQTHTKHISIIDKPTFERLFKEYFAPLSYYAAKFLPGIETAKEIVHDVFINFWEKRESIDLNKSVKSYLYTSVHNRCLNFIRDNKKFNRDEYILEAHSETNWQNSDILIEAEIKAKINETLNQLPGKCKQVFIMNRYEGLKYREIAEQLGISVKTVEVQMSKALKLFRKNLEEYITVLLVFLLLNK